MNWRNYFVLFLVGILIVSIVGLFQSAPGYMDADYYYAGGLRLVQGYGFSEPFLWNYLDNPSGLPHPSHAYWMPLASLVAAVGMLISRDNSYTAAKIGFLVVAGFIPVLTAALCFSITSRKDQAWLAGLLAVLPGFYLSYLGTTDVFGIYMLLGASWLLVIGHEGLAGSYTQAILIGIISGLMHLTRADGLLWLLLALLGMIFVPITKNGDHLFTATQWSTIWKRLLLIASCFMGYLVVMGPWMIRNYLAYGMVIAPGGIRSLWLTGYDELYAYPASMLTPTRWLASGLRPIIAARVQALGQNLQTAGAVQGEIFLAPLVLMGLWFYRRDIRVRFGVVAWFLTFLVMTIVFPYVGWRGGFFHSGAAFQPLFWAMAPAGLMVFIKWGMRLRNWNYQQATSVFRVALIGLAFMLAVLVVRNRVVGENPADPIWGKSETVYQNVEKNLQQVGARPDDVVMVNNAPGYYIASGREALSIPTGGLPTILQLAHRYGASYLLLEKNQGLTDLYDVPMGHPGLEYLMTSNEVRIFRID